MKKITALLLVLMMIFTLAACKGKTPAEPAANGQTDAKQTPEGDPAEYGREFWEAKYPGENICPFTIDENGTERSYYWVSGLEGWDGTVAAWIKQPFNWNGWHVAADGAIVNKDETLKITDDWATGKEGLSSCCTVTTEKYGSGTAQADTAPAPAQNTDNPVESVFKATSSGAQATVKLDASVKMDDTSAWLGLCPAGKTYVTELEADEVDVVWYNADAREKESDPYVFSCDFSDVADGTYAVVVATSDDENVGYIAVQLEMTKAGNKLTFNFEGAKLNKRPAK